MSSVQTTYLDWEALAHGPGCRYPQWSVDLSTEYNAFRGRRERPEHSCPNEGCGHADRMDRTTVRIVCVSCGVAFLLSGESADQQRSSTEEVGFGQAPRRVAGLYLWPGEPLLHGWGTGVDTGPWGWLVTRNRVARVRAADVVGEIACSRGPRGGSQFAALAGPSPKGTYGHPHVRYTDAVDGLKSVAAAAKWIAAHPATLTVGVGS